MKKIIYYTFLFLAFLALVYSIDFVTAVLVVISFLFYFLPSIIGEKKKNATSIFLLNFFLGWTFIGWVVAIVWAVSKDNPDKTIIIESKKSVTDQLKSLKELYEDGTLTKEEFDSQKANILKN